MKLASLSKMNNLFSEYQQYQDAIAEEEGEFDRDGRLKSSSNYLSNNYQPVGDVLDMKVHKNTSIFIFFWYKLCSIFYTVMRKTVFSYIKNYSSTCLGVVIIMLHAFLSTFPTVHSKQ